ncbi:MAG: restriction endonuclease subunit S [Gemmatimonadetes bacterium]|nr:restriction endonuclease subunit S [Gemmatimonadota bacterium]
MTTSAVEASNVQRAAGLRRFKPYPAYKDSGVEWLGEIPAGWEVKRLKFVAPARMGKLDKKPDDAVYVGLEHVESWTGRLLLDSQPESVDSVVAAFRAGDVLFGKLRPYLAKTARPDFDGVCTSEILPLRPSIDSYRSYVMYGLLNAPYIRWLNSLTNGTKMPRVSPEQVGSSFLTVPPEPDQRAIAAFLDRATARIDGLVAKKERLIELLQEKRTALITRAVTKGLDPNVPMKDSGVEWLGEIPAGWEVKHLRWAIMFQRGHDLPTDEREDGQIPVVTSSGISSTHSRAVAKAPGIVTGRYGTIGHFHLITQDYWPLNTTLYSIDLRGNDPRFLRHMLEHLSPLFLLNAVKSAVPGVDRNDIHPTATAVPPFPEQLRIADFLDARNAEIASLVAKVREAIERLKELRTALISAAVTGKIDVREEVTI